MRDCFGERALVRDRRKLRSNIRRRADIRSVDTGQFRRVGRNGNWMRLSGDWKPSIFDDTAKKSEEDKFTVIFLVRVIHKRYDRGIELLVILLVGGPVGRLVVFALVPSATFDSTIQGCLVGKQVRVDNDKLRETCGNRTGYGPKFDQDAYQCN